MPNGGTNIHPENQEDVKLVTKQSLAVFLGGEEDFYVLYDRCLTQDEQKKAIQELMESIIPLDSPVTPIYQKERSWSCNIDIWIMDEDEGWQINFLALTPESL